MYEEPNQRTSPIKRALLNPQPSDLIFDYERAFCRNIGVISSPEQQSLKSKCVAIPGCGGVGSLHTLIMARMGVGNFVLADFDRYEIENMNRQFGAKLSTVGKTKVETIQREILDINPDARIKIFPEGIRKENIEEFLKEADLVIDSLDFFAFSARNILFPSAQKHGVPLLTAAPMGLSCGLLLFTKEGMGYSKYFDFHPEDSEEERVYKFSVGLLPSCSYRAYMDPKSINLTLRKAPSHMVGVSLCGALIAGEALKILLGKGTLKAVPHFYEFDSYHVRFRKGYLWFGNRNLFQRLKMASLKKLLKETMR